MTGPYYALVGQMQNLDVNGAGKSISEEYLGIMERLNSACNPILQNIYNNRTPGELIKYTRAPGYYETGRQTVRIKEIYNPASTDWMEHATYISNLMPRKVSVLFVGMNPTRFSRAGLPFSDRDAFLDFWKIDPPGHGFNKMIESLAENGNECMSGRRFWKFIKEFFKNKSDYKDHCFVMNCSPLIITGHVEPSSSGFGNVPLDNFEGNETPTLLSKLMDESKKSLEEAINKMKPMLIVGFGRYATNIAHMMKKDRNITCEYAAHPAAWQKFPTDEAWINSLKEGHLAVKIRETITKAKQC